MNELLTLMVEFFKTGLFAIGGGLATLPFLQAIGEKTGWFTNADLANMVAVSESTPGPIGINMATYVGFSQFGLPGALLSTLSLIAPSILVILIISGFLDRFKSSAAVQRCFYGLRPASTGLIAAALVGVIQIALIHWDAFTESGLLTDLISPGSLVLALLLLYLTNHAKTKGLHPFVFLAGSALVGILFSFD